MGRLAAYEKMRSTKAKSAVTSSPRVRKSRFDRKRTGAYNDDDSDPNAQNGK